MSKIILFIFFSFGGSDAGPLKDIITIHKEIPSLEPSARKILDKYGVIGDKFVFLTPYSEDVQINVEFSILFLDGIKLNGQHLPTRMKFNYVNESSEGPDPGGVMLTRYIAPLNFKYADAVCGSLVLSKKYVSCALAEKYVIVGTEIKPPASIAFPNIDISKNPKPEYLWLTSGAVKILGTQYKDRDVLRIKGNKIILGQDKNTGDLNWGGKSD